MKRFYIKSCVFLLLIGCLVYGIGIAYRSTISYQNMLINEGISEWPYMPEQITLAVFGPSTGQHGIVNPPEEYKDSFFNFCLSSQTPQYDFQVMQSYSDHIQSGATVILTVFYASPYWTDTEDAFNQKQSRYYHILEPEYIVDVDLSRYWLQRFSPILTAEFSTILSSLLTTPERALTPVQIQGTKKCSSEDATEQQDRLKESQWASISPCFPDVNPVMWDAYHSMLNLCREKEWNAVLVLPPYLPEYNVIFPTEFYPAFQERMTELSEEYDVPFLDYSHDAFYAGRYELFRDIYHLNSAGAKVFNAQLFADIAAIFSDRDSVK